MALTTEQKKHRKVRRAWIKALRSGNYKRGTGSLHTREKTDKFCCLGVLCDLAVKAKVIKAPEREEDSQYFAYGLERDTDLLPYEVQEWAGIDTDDGTYYFGDGQETSLATQNDSGKTFKKIADIIEKNPEGLFVD